MSARTFGPPAVAAVTLVLAAALALAQTGPALLALAGAAQGYDIGNMVLLYSRLPRMAVALMSGAALALSGAILQQILRNPLASPTTLGISAGANLALAVATLQAPLLVGFGRDLVALTGSAVSTAIVFALGARRGFQPMSLVLSGLVVSLYCGALSALLVLMNDRYLVSLFIWGAGSLAQQDWQVALSLLPRLAACGVAVALVARPFGLLELGEAGATSLGLSVTAVRAVGLCLGVALTALVTSAVGVVGFVGLVAPTIARLAGARRFRDRLLWSPPIGAGLLWLTDEAVQGMAGGLAGFVPTGAVTALLGSPLLLILLPRLRAGWQGSPGAGHAPCGARPATALCALLLGGLALLSAAALFLGRAPDGAWSLLRPDDWASVLPWRWPRVFAALAAGVMLAAAGTVLQRVTRNPIASPEVLGVSAGATLGVTVMLFLRSGPTYAAQVPAAAAAALATLGLILLFSRRSGFAPERVLLAGVALSAFVDAVAGALAATGDPRALQVLRWMSGSTYAVGPTAAAVTLGLAAVLLALAFLAHRWLDLLPLGDATAQALGLPLGRARVALLCVAAITTAAATLVVGPLSFVGLMAPHMAREMGLVRALPQLAGAVLVGAALMVAADWTGRMADFPYQMPAGLVSALIGGPFLMLLLRGRGRAVSG